MSPLVSAFRFSGSYIIAALAAHCMGWAQFVYEETFSNTTAPGWTFVQGGTDPGPRLTANLAPDAADPETGPQIDADGNGWLRLATRTGYQANVVTLSTKIPSQANNVTFTFDFTIWDRSGGTGADGLSFFIYDGDAAFDPGADGGSLGYAQKTGVDGLEGGYFGVGLDVYGNFSNDQEGRSGALGGGDLPNSLNPNQVVVRGPGSGTTGYEYLAGTGGNNYTVGGNPSISSLSTDLSYELQDFRPDQDSVQFRRLQLELTDTDLLTVRLQSGYGNAFTDLYTVDLSSFSRPEEIRIGFGAATGGVDQVYEVRNLLVTASGLANTWYWTNGANPDNFIWSDAFNWNPSASAPDDFADVVFSSEFSTSYDGNSTITVDGPNKNIANLFFSGEHSFTLTPDSGQQLIFDTNGVGSSELNILNNPSGNADHTIQNTISLENQLSVNNLVSQLLTLSGTISQDTHALTFNTVGQTHASGNITQPTSPSRAPAPPPFPVIIISPAMLLSKTVFWSPLPTMPSVTLAASSRSKMAPLSHFPAATRYALLKMWTLQARAKTGSALSATLMAPTVGAVPSISLMMQHLASTPAPISPSPAPVAA